MLNHEQARSFYDRFGVRQDRQGWYEDAAVEDMCKHAGFGSARAVFEFGCGTGRLARQLLDRDLPQEARYTGQDVSPVMIGLARHRLHPFEDRVHLRLSSGGMRLEECNGSHDRFIACYVFDLLADTDIEALLNEAHRILEPRGLLCTAGLTWGDTALSRAVSRLWSRVHRCRPEWVGGCRPLELQAYLSEEFWEIRHRRIVRAWGIASETIVAQRRP